MKGFFKGFFLTILLFAVVVVGYGLYTAKTLTGKDPVTLFKSLQKEPDKIDFLVLGVDSSDKNKNKSTRSDVMMIVSLDPQTKKANIISIPRDTRVKISGRKNYQKINAAYAFGGKELTLKTVNEVFGLNLDKYVLVDYDVVRRVVDKLGGVKIDVPIDMKYTDEWDDPPLIIDIKQGEQVLDGETAVKFLRFRKNSDGSGYKNQDLERVDSQKMFVAAVLDKITSPKGLLKIPALINIYENNVDTNIQAEDLLSFFNIIRKSEDEKMQGYTLPGGAKYINKVSYFIFDENETNVLFKTLNIK